MSGELVTLARALSKLGYCSRSRAPLFVKDGKVSVNGKITRVPSTPVSLDKDIIKIENNRIARPATYVIMVHKPNGYVTTASDELSRRTVYDLVPSNLHLFPVGRLDLETSGLLLFTNNGAIQDRINSPGSNVSKTYICTISGKVTADQIRRLIRGVEIRDGVVCKMDQCNIVETEISCTRLSIKIHEGKNREIRRMFEAIGKKVTNLHRTTIGKLELDLAAGNWRKLSEEEIESIFE